LKLPAQLLSGLRQHNPDFILHTGDITIRQVIRELEKIAPVIAVRGNRDQFTFSYLPLVKRIHLGGNEITLLHGHSGLWGYLREKIRIFLYGNRLELLLPRVLKAGKGADVIVFGHSHLPLNEWYGSQLLLNPGSPSVPVGRDGKLSYGMLYIFEDQPVKGEIFLL
jgi:hypothetical protein